MRLYGSSIALGAFVAVSLAASPATAQEGGLGLNVLSLLGITTETKPEIEYRERPPLVVPPRSTLPSPQDGVGRSRANWPDDHDRQRRRAANADANTPATERERYRLNQGSGRLPSDELARGRGGSGGGARMASPSDNDPYELLYGPMRQMRAADAASAARGATAEVPLGREAPRRFLSEPPSGLRTATQRVAPGPQAPVVRSESTGQVEFLTGRPVPN